MPIVHKHFSSPAAYANWAQETMFTAEAEKNASTHSYARNAEIVKRGIDFLLSGDTSLVAQAQEMARKFTEQIPSLRKVWANDVAGFFPNVPAYLAGEPETMWRMDTEETDTTPIRIWVGITSTGSVSQEQIKNRGIALAAFAIALSEKRPVLITPYVHHYKESGRGGYEQASFISWDLQASPFVFSQLCSLTNPEITRYLGCRASLYQNTATGHSYLISERTARRILGCSDEDIWLGPASISDPLISDPVAWIKKQLVKYAGVEEEEKQWTPSPAPRDETYTCPVCRVKFNTWNEYYAHLPKNPKCEKWVNDYYKQIERDGKERERIGTGRG